MSDERDDRPRGSTYQWTLRDHIHHIVAAYIGYKHDAECVDRLMALMETPPRVLPEPDALEATRDA